MKTAMITADENGIPQETLAAIRNGGIEITCRKCLTEAELIARIVGRRLSVARQQHEAALDPLSELAPAADVCFFVEHDAYGFLLILVCSRRSGRKARESAMRFQK